MGRIELHRDFERVWPLAARILQAYMRRLGTPPERVEDLVQEVASRIWQRREDLCFDSEAQWLAYSKQVGDNLARDTYQKELREIAMGDSADSLEDRASPTFSSLLESVLESNRVLQAADDLWLGDRPAQHKLKLLALTLLVKDNRRVSDILALLKRDGTLHAADLPSVVGDRRTVLEFIYRSLHMEPEQITSHVLGVDKDALHNVVSLAHQGQFFKSRTGVWSAFETKIVLRKCCGFEATSIILRSFSTEQHEDIRDATVRLCRHLPFMNSMNLLARRLSNHKIGLSCAKEPGLWKRLAFQYVAGECLPHQDFVAWFGPVARVSGFPLSSLTLHAWISNRRLVNELRKHLKMGEYGLQGE